MSNIVNIIDFLNLLNSNNNRLWFNDHKPQFLQLRDAWISDIAILLSRMSGFDPTLINVDAKSCVYRIYRDTRFSPNKSPYKNHFGALLGLGGTKCQLACYYIHIQPGACGIYGGLWCPERDLLNKLRHAIDDNFDEFSAIINAPEFKKRFDVVGESLKRIPIGFNPATPAAKFVKMKEFLLSMPVPDSYFIDSDWIERAARDFSFMKPFNDFLNYTITEEL